MAGLFGDVDCETEISIGDVEAVALSGFEVIENFFCEQGGFFGSGEIDPAIASHGFETESFIEIGQVSAIICEQAAEELWGIVFDF